MRPRVRVELFDLAITEHAKADYPFDPRQHGVGLIVEATVTGLEAALACSGVNPAAVLGIGVGVPGIVENVPDGLLRRADLRLGVGPAGTPAPVRHQPAAAHRQLRQDHGTG